MIPSLTHDPMGRRYKRAADRRRCERQDNPKPRPSDAELLAMYARLTAPQIADDLGRNPNTVRAWINRARWRA
jgi:DNA-directed RNA polymerase specialized sigma24 family protein